MSSMNAQQVGTSRSRLCLTPISRHALRSQGSRRLQLCRVSMQQHGANEPKAPATTSIARRQLLTAVGTAVLALSTAQWPALAAGSTVFVAGSTGSTGKLVIQELSSRGISVRAGTRNPDKGKALGWGKNVEQVAADVTDSPESLSKAIGSADTVICTIGAGGSDLSGPKKIDNEGTKHLIDAAKKAGVKKFVLMSSLLTNGAAAGQRLNPNYLFLQAFGGVLSNKLEAEKYLRNSGLSWVIVRPGGLSNASPGEVGNLVLRGEDQLFGRKEDPGRSISRQTVAEVLVEAALQRQAQNKVVEIVASKKEDAPPKDKWFA